MRDTGIYDEEDVVARLKMDMSYDFADVIDWSVKDVYVYVAAKFKDDNGVRSYSVLYLHAPIQRGRSVRDRARDAIALVV